MFRANEARVIVLRVVCEMKWAEIAERMDVSRMRIFEIWKRTMRRADKTGQITRFVSEHSRRTSDAGAEAKTG